MNLERLKFVICSGCSYDKFSMGFQQLQSSGNYFDDDTIQISLGVPGFGNAWVAHSARFCIDFLLKHNVKPENIYTLISWTGYIRYGIEERVEIEEDLQPIAEIYTGDISTELKELTKAYILKNLKLKRSKNLSSVGYVGDMKITYPIITFTNDKQKPTPEEDSPENRQLLASIEKKAKTISNEDTYRMSLDYVKFLGDYLIENKIDHNFTSMYSFFNGYLEKNPWFTHGIKTLYANHNDEYINISNKGEVETLGQPAEEFFPNLKESILEIKNKYNWTFYEKGKVLDGGIDEYCMNEYGEKPYLRESPITKDTYAVLMGHPSHYYYPTIFKYFAKNFKGVIHDFVLKEFNKRVNII